MYPVLLLCIGLVLGVAITSSTQDTSFRSLFRRMPQLKLTAAPTVVLSDLSGSDQCAKACVEQTTFDCRSFDVDNLGRTCILFNTSFEEDGHFLQNSPNVDHYRSAYDRLFSRLPGHVLTLKHRRLVEGASVPHCARRCVFEQEFQCAGFDYEPEYANCWLTDLTLGTSKFGPKRQAGADYYMLNSHGAVDSFIGYGSGSLPFVDSQVLYRKTVYGLELESCAQACLAQTEFQCSSFDFTFVDLLCQMSEYTASSVGGMDTARMPTNRVVHFERKGPNLKYFNAIPFSAVGGKHDQVLDNVTPEACAQACLDQTVFICSSFDYSIEDDSCMLNAHAGSEIGRTVDSGLGSVHHFELRPSLSCGGDLVGIAGNFASPGWPRSYGHNLNCTWTVRAPEHKVITFDFLHFDLGVRGITSCIDRGDRLRINEDTPFGKMHFCASYPMTTYVSQTNVVMFNLLTDSIHDAQGFRMVYTVDWPCRAVFREDLGEMATPKWPEESPEGQNCAWSIQAPSGGRIRLEFDSIDLQDTDDCSTDSIFVFDGPDSNSSRLVTMCGNDAPTSVVSSENVLLVTFKTRSRGFHARYRFILPPAPPTTRQPTTQTTGHHGRLSASFVEPNLRPGHANWTVYYQDDLNTGHKESNSYVSILFSALIGLILFTTVLAIVVLLVCKQQNRLKNHQNATRKNQRPNPDVEEAILEEGKPLCDPETVVVKCPDIDLADKFPETKLEDAYQLWKANHLSGKSQVTISSESDVSGYSSDSKPCSSEGSVSPMESGGQTVHYA